MRYMPPAAVRSLISRSELRLDRTKKPYAYSWRYFVLPDVFTKICHKKSDGGALRLKLQGRCAAEGGTIFWVRVPVFKRRNPIEFGLVFNDAKEV
ncbi:hypothetical protein EVAR_102490_1 [Eumeta japonica]|uniref:Uncharacterized protein n=1 Tax=Eumeta variegata TaxID=151549 RepID=A0A4C1ZFC9_EUMVA|nr:hypothetical protein EVAR_102490_1 [Eumeta japonica]